MDRKLLLALLFSSLMFSQNNTVNVSDVQLDMNGDLIRIGNPQTTVQQNYTPYSVDDYDNVRALSELNTSNSGEAYPWISPDGLHLYFTQGISIYTSLYYTSRANVSGNFSTATLLPITFPDGTSIISCWLSSDELDIYVSTRSGLFYAHRTSQSLPFGAASLISLNGSPAFSFCSGASLNAAQNTLYAYVNMDTAGQGILKFTRSSATSFVYAGILQSLTPYKILAGQLSKDDLAFMFSAEYAATDSKIAQLTRTATTTDFSLDSFSILQGVNNARPINIQPSATTNQEWIAFVKNTTGDWSDNDMYIAHNNQFPLGNNENTFDGLSVYPNPSDGKFIFQSTNADDYLVEVYNAVGQKITAKQSGNELDLSGYSKGIYLIKFTANNSTTVKKVTLK